MEVTTCLFWIFSIILIGSAISVIVAKNPVYAVLSLVLCFFQASFIWMLLKAEFLAMTLVLVYVGAVMVLFLFVVMMLDIDFSKLRLHFKRYMGLGSVFAAVLVFEIFSVVFKGFYNPIDSSSSAAAMVGQTSVLGLSLFTQYSLAVEVASVILLVAVVAAIALTLRSRKDVKYNEPVKAIRTQAKDRLKIVHLQPIQPKPVEGVVDLNVINTVDKIIK